MSADYAVIAGRGQLPVLVINELKDAKVICFEGEQNPRIKPDLITRFGKIGGIIEYLNNNGIKKIVFAGAMNRPDLKSLSPDGEGAKLLAKIMAASMFGKSVGDDKLLTTITKHLEGKGFEVVGAQEIIHNLKTPKGLLTKTAPNETQKADIEIGRMLLEKISEFDIGQAVAIEDGIVLAVEAAEGTEKMIERVGRIKKSYGGVIVKCKKLDQSDKVDLPSIGPDTINQVAAAGIKGIAMQAGESLIIEREEIIKRANDAGVFLIGI